MPIPVSDSNQVTTWGYRLYSNWCPGESIAFVLTLTLLIFLKTLESLNWTFSVIGFFSFAAEKWMQSVLGKPKLRTYKLFKQELQAEDYVNRLMSCFQPSTFAKLRCGILPIQIEIGRFRGQNVKDRFCPVCRKDVESELHFMFEYQAYENSRKSFLINSRINPLSSSTDKRKHCIRCTYCH